MTWRVLLATCAAWPEGEPGGDLLLEAFAERDVDARWAAWDDPGVDWATADRVLVRSTWDYTARLEEFLAWARDLGDRLVHPAGVLAWNTDKSYLLELADRLPVVPTAVLDSAELPDAVARLGSAVLKPPVSAGGRGVRLVEHPLEATDLEPGRTWVVQPVVGSVRTEGETSVLVLGGRPVAQVLKTPAPGGEILVHETYGGSSRAVPLDREHAALAARTVAVASELLGSPLLYARVDSMRHDGELVLSELEIAEPGLYLDVVPEVAPAFADAVVERLAAER